MILHIGATAQLSSEESEAVRWYCKSDPSEVVSRVAAKSGRSGAEEFVQACLEMHSTERRSTPRTDAVAAAFGEIPRRDPGAW